MTDTIKIYEVSVSYSDEVQVCQAEAKATAKQVRIVKRPDRSHGAWNYRTIVPLEEVHRTPEAARAAFCEQKLGEIDRLAQRAAKIRAQLDALPDAPLRTE